MDLGLDTDYVHVVLGIIKNTRNEVLVTRREEDAHLGGLLEFPGGKVESNETPIQALARELREELNINLHACTRLIQVPFHYPDRKVFLDVYIIDNYLGNIIANEIQDISWQDISSLNKNDFPPANFGIIRALQLPQLIAVTPDFSHLPRTFLSNFEKTLRRDDIQITHLRSHELSDAKYNQLAEDCLRKCSAAARATLK